MEITFSAEIISGIVGGILAGVFAYFPKLNTSYAGLSSEKKSLIMIGMLLVVSISIAILSSYGVIHTAEPVTWVTVARIFISALIVNQPMHNILPEATAVTEAKTTRDANVAETK